MSKLSLKQKRFADEYIISGNVYQSLINAGYSNNYAKSDGCKILENPSVKNYIEEKLNEIEASKYLSVEEALIKTRDFHLYAVRKIMYYLQQLTDEEVELLELRYWHRIEIKHIARMYYCSRSAMYRKFDVIFEKLGQCPLNFMV